MVRVLPVLHVLSAVIAIFGLTMLVPLAVSLAIGDGASWAYDEAMLVTFAAGAALWGATRGHKRELQIRDGFLLVSLVWTVLPAFATIPLMVAIPGLSFTDAYFESVSGLTTSGATVLTGLDHLPQSLNVWRTQLVWMGGMGVVVLAVAILPLLGVGGAQVFKAETPGPMKDQKLTPRIAQTAKGLWLVYGLITAACLLAFKWAGMTWLDALIHSFSTMGLGGFSSHDASFAWFDSARIDYVTVVFMLIAGINFGTHFLFFRSRSLGVYRRDPEALPFLAVAVGSGLFIALFLLEHRVYEDFPTALRYALFNVVSIATTTGFASTDFSLWPIFAPVWMLFLSSFATSSGSTGGGIKMIRAKLQVMQAWRELRRIVHPRALIPVKLGGQPVENNIIFAVLAFMLMYGATMIVATMLLTFTGLDIVSAFSAVIACINNMGPGLGEVGPASNYQGLSDFQTWVCTATMLLGRLELFTLLVVFTPGFWRQ
ncbi:MAG: TrkH family potassium uptake protein [Burkholderiales bacterium]|nr:TrkH family potassium uptake protein [Burkholderiales bacterium]